MLNFDARIKNSDAAQPRVTNVKTPIAIRNMSEQPTTFEDELNAWEQVHRILFTRRRWNETNLQSELIFHQKHCFFSKSVMRTFSHWRSWCVRKIE